MEAVEEKKADVSEMPDPFKKWIANWKPPEEAFTLSEVLAICDQDGRDLIQVLCASRCRGFTMHKTVDLPPDVWVREGWQWDVEENRCGQPQYGEHLQFQVAVLKSDVVGVVEEEISRPIDPSSAVEDFEFEVLPHGWGIRIVGGVPIVWQAHCKETTFGPMRMSLAEAVADAWAFDAHSRWP